MVRWLGHYTVAIGTFNYHLYGTQYLRSRISSLRPLLHPLYILLHHPLLDEQNSEAMDNSCLHELFTLPPGEDVDFSLAAVTDPSQYTAVGDNKQEADESYGNASSANNGNSDSMVPDLQGDQLDDNDAQIAEPLFGQTQSFVVDNSIAVIDPKSVVEASMSDERCASVHHDVDEGPELSWECKTSDRLMSTTFSQRRLYPSTIRMPGKFLHSCMMQIPRTEESKSPGRQM
jgi:hypothetical protein